MRRCLRALLTICIIAAVCSVTSASTITVPDDFNKIQDAIDDPNTVDGDTILIKSRIYNEHDLDTGDKQLTFTGETHADGSPAVTIDAQGVGRVWHIDNTNTISDECPPECPDANGDGDTDLDDLILVIDAWGTPDINSDFDGDGVVGIHDLLDLLEAWGSCGS